MAKEIIDSQLLTIGLLGLGAYVVYRSGIAKDLGAVSSGLGTAVGGLGSGISTGAGGLGQGISETGQAVGAITTALANFLQKTSSAGSQITTTTGTETSKLITSTGTSASKIVDIPGNAADIFNVMLDRIENTLKGNSSISTSKQPVANTNNIPFGVASAVGGGILYSDGSVRDSSGSILRTAGEQQVNVALLAKLGDNKIIPYTSTKSVSSASKVITGVTNSTPKTSTINGVTWVTKQPGYVYNVDTGKYVKK